MKLSEVAMVVPKFLPLASFLEILERGSGVPYIAILLCNHIMHISSLAWQLQTLALPIWPHFELRFLRLLC